LGIQEEEKKQEIRPVAAAPKKPTGHPVSGFLSYSAKLYLTALEGRTFSRWLKRVTLDPHSKVGRGLRRAFIEMEIL
jgi:hypothetical protein